MGISAAEFDRIVSTLPTAPAWPLPIYQRAPTNSKGGYLDYEGLRAETVRRRAAAWGPFLPPCANPVARYVPHSDYCRCGYPMGAHKGGAA